MANTNPIFPYGVWNGLSRNTQRTSLADSQSPEAGDWDQIVAEVISVENFLFNLTSGGEVYTALADEDIQQGRLVRLTSQGRLVLAGPSSPTVSGMAIATAEAGSNVSYIRRGRVESSDWTDVVGAETLTPGTDYYLVAAGQMSSIAPHSGYVVRVGQAQSSMTHDLDIGQGIKL